MKPLLLSALLALTLPGQAAIILDTETRLLGNLFFPPDENIRGSYELNFDLNGDNQVDFGLGFFISRVGSRGSGVFDPSGTTRFVYANDNLASLEGGFELGPDLIDPFREFRSTIGPGSETLASVIQNIRYGEFFGGGTSYLGFEFQADTATHYGYLEITNQGASGLIIEKSAWESTPGKSIVTGGIPEPSTCLLVSLAIATGLTRRKRTTFAFAADHSTRNPPEAT